VQLLLIAPEHGFLSIALAPWPHALRRVLWPFPGGEVPLAIDKSAPSRAFAKLVEAEQRLGRRIGPKEECVDLGASPGSWSYVALRRGARVLAVDRAPLRADLMSHRWLTFRRGDAFSYEPKRPVDWLLCDVVAAPGRSIELLMRWVREQWAANFVVTIKFKGTEEYGLLERLKHALPPLCQEFHLTRLWANRNEVCAFGAVKVERGKSRGLETTPVDSADLAPNTKPASGWRR
jgi:23S rRNA (cytidine2498-2'-O)-methyltransferase